MLRTNFLYEHRFGSFFYVHVTRKKLPKQHSYETRVKNVDEIDYRKYADREFYLMDLSYWANGLDGKNDSEKIVDSARCQF